MSEKNSTLLVQKATLTGSVAVAGAKNSALRLLAASLLTRDEIVLTNYPADLLDAQVHVGMLETLGKSVEVLGPDSIKITQPAELSSELRWEGRSIRNTLLVLGALTARTGAGRVPLPGGCRLGERKYDLHVMLLEALGAHVWEDGDNLCAEAPRGLVGTDIHLPMRSTGATENAIIAGALAQGTTRIWNPHIRPEILDLIRMLESIGSSITVYGQEHIEVVGSEALSGCEHDVIPDNMEAITWLVASAVTGGDIEIFGFPHKDLEVVLAHLRSAGAGIYRGDNSIIVRGSTCYPIEISTGPHPGINSDVQPILAAWAANARGESTIVDLRFPGRYAYATELEKMGLSYAISGDALRIHGAGGKLQGAEVTALDLRAGAALTLCGLTAEGQTTIRNAWQISRGYSNWAGKLNKLGASVSYID